MKTRTLTLQKGFTLIELLVVIAVIGVLAAAVLAAINPAKRINQANDARSKNDIGVVSRAMSAYYTATGASGTPYYPAAVADLVTNQDLASEPKDPVTAASYTIVKTPAACTTALANCTNIAVYGVLRDAAAGQVWCWRSSNNSISQVATAACTAP